MAPRHTSRLLYLAITAFFLYILHSRKHGQPALEYQDLEIAAGTPSSARQGSGGPPSAEHQLSASRKAIVLASMKHDDTNWTTTYFPNWETHRYVMDNPSQDDLTVPKNKGRESTAYLTFLIDNYDKLPDFMVFMHALRYQWHNEDPLFDGVPPLKALRLLYVAKEGYANMRCTWTLGCPEEIKPMLLRGPDARKDDRLATEHAFADAFLELFPGEEVPDRVGINCGAQFALSRQKVHERPKEDYIRYRNWLWDTNLPDNVSGRILEYTWHMIMGKPAVHCPQAQSCFCEKFGLCDLECNSIEHCERRFHLPMYSVIPDGWPTVGTGEHGFQSIDWFLPLTEDEKRVGRFDRLDDFGNAIVVDQKEP